MFLQEPECLDQWHADETVSWVAVEAGVWLNNVGNGGFQAGVAAAQGAIWETVPASTRAILRLRVMDRSSLTDC